MPEGDTIHKHGAELRARLQGQKVTAVFARGLEYRRLAGASVEKVEVHGKHLFIDVGPARLHVHLGMYGRMFIQDARTVTTGKAARASLAVVGERAAALWWRAPTVEVLRAAFAHAHPALQTLGPDVLAPDFQPAAAVSRARERPATTLGELLLDQRVAAGIGNVYKSEILFLERLDPFAPVSSVDDATLDRVYALARELMSRNLGPWRRTTTADLTRGGFGPRGSARVHVYRRAGHPCRVCGAAILAAAQGQPPRKTYYCPRCQARGARGAPAP
ncbi:MAG TPA: DNA-formamidopyrimidine glycosylase family protein [Polyangia bacterium]|nr:DNA-formamidopyrimidine glycosylase family protein [Polyangia bacterium]